MERATHCGRQELPDPDPVMLRTRGGEGPGRAGHTAQAEEEGTADTALGQLLPRTNYTETMQRKQEKACEGGMSETRPGHRPHCPPQALSLRH